MRCTVEFVRNVTVYLLFMSLQEARALTNINQPPPHLDRMYFWTQAKRDPCGGFMGCWRDGFKEEANRMCARAQESYHHIAAAVRSRSRCRVAEKAECQPKYCGSIGVCMFYCITDSQGGRQWMSIRKVAGFGH
ncbi:uncharacterized protein [Bemisia tabaci]|uniref:uncharacterized protein n=1 Tax=Bemisia tabaci TaxID=7038 RepID=UPI003B27ECF0